MCCCRKERQWKEDNLTDGAILNDRHCTDCPMIIIFLMFLIVWAVLLAIVLLNGDPSRIIRPANFAGDLCGLESMKDFRNLFVPLPNRPTYGICTATCPAPMSYVCNNVEEQMLGEVTANMVPNTYYNHTEKEFSAGRDLLMKCGISCSSEEKAHAKKYAGLIKKLAEFKCFLAFYKTGPTLYRCLPFEFDMDNKTLLGVMNETTGSLKEFADMMGVGSFFSRGFAEVYQCWIMIAICCVTAAIISFLWVLLMRWILAPIIYLCLILIFVMFIITGVLALMQAKNLDDVRLPGQKGTEDQVTFWKSLGYIAFILAVLYLVIVLVVSKRIRIAIVLMEEASRAFTANPVLILLPPIILVILFCFIAFFIVTSIYIQSMGEINEGHIRPAAVSIFGENIVDATAVKANVGIDLLDSSIPHDIGVKTFNTTISIKGLHAFNFFGILWAANIVVMFGFFVMAMVVATWYFSATGVQIDTYERGDKSGRLKSTKAGTFCGAFCCAIRYHLGTIIFGALLIAIIQFIRAVVLYIEHEYLSKWKHNTTVKVLLYIINCCLECIERLIRIISKSAFVITCVKNTNFCSSAVDAVRILVSNVIRVGTLTTLCTATCFLIKMSIVGANLLIAYGLMRVKYLTDNEPVESGLFPLLGILVLTFLVSSLFVNVFEACVDTIMICFFIDESDFEGKFLPPTLAKLVDKFTHIERARLEYEEKINMTFSNGTTSRNPNRSSYGELAVPLVDI